VIVRDHSDLRRLRRKVLRWTFALGIAFVFIGGVLLSPLVAVNNISVNGADGDDAEAVRQAVAVYLSSKRLGFVPVRHSMALVDEVALARSITDQVPVVRAASASVDWPHDLAVQVELRTPRGIWCPASREASQDKLCEYWDESGARWGQTAPSVGPLLLLVRDERTDEGDRLRMLAGILAAVDGVGALGLHARSVTLPDAEPGGIRVSLTGKYDLLFDALGDVPDQLATLEVLLADKAKDPAFRPAYIDLRTPGRVYYK
jgi:hypothetical protein